jgi:hypothetical protein
MDILTSTYRNEIRGRKLAELKCFFVLAVLVSF